MMQTTLASFSRLTSSKEAKPDDHAASSQCLAKNGVNWLGTGKDVTMSAERSRGKQKSVSFA